MSQNEGHTNLPSVDSGSPGREIISCPNSDCRQSVAIPRLHKKLKVTCPYCAHFWYYEGGVESLILHFRCSLDDQSFTVKLQRTSNDQLFTIITDGINLCSNESSHNTQVANLTRNTVLANEISWENFYCDCCRFRPKGDQAAFVRCNSCGRFVCGRSISTSSEGTRTFSCPCGNRGPLTSGGKGISEYVGLWSEGAGKTELPSISFGAVARLAGATQKGEE